MIFDNIAIVCPDRESDWDGAEGERSDLVDRAVRSCAQLVTDSEEPARDPTRTGPCLHRRALRGAGTVRYGSDDSGGGRLRVKAVRANYGKEASRENCKPASRSRYA